MLYINVPDPRLTLSDFATRFYKLKPKNIVGVTGTNGKSTTSKILSHVLKKNNFQPVLGGNIGAPVLSLKIKKNQLTLTK